MLGLRARWLLLAPASSSRSLSAGVMRERDPITKLPEEDEQKMQREEDLRMGLRLYKDGKYESVLGSKPESNEASIASYNVACCYSKLDQIQAGLSALEDALKAGYEDFKAVALRKQTKQRSGHLQAACASQRIRTNPDLANLRKSEEFDTLLKKYDESFINENAINAIKSLFGFNKK